jgi:transposase
MIKGMKAPIFIRPLTQDEHRQIQAGLRSSNAFVLRRCQVLLASARGEHASTIAKHLGCDDQTVRNAIKGFNARGLAALKEGSSRPHRLRTTFTIEAARQLKALLHRSPHDFGLDRGLWTLELAAKISFEQGIIPHETDLGERAPSPPTLRHQLEARQTLDYQPRSPVPAKKNARDRLMAWASTQPGWAIGFLDEVWWSRFALPRLHAQAGMLSSQSA